MWIALGRRNLVGKTFYVMNDHLENYCTSARKGGNTSSLLDF